MIRINFFIFISLLIQNIHSFSCESINWTFDVTDPDGYLCPQEEDPADKCHNGPNGGTWFGLSNGKYSTTQQPSCGGYKNGSMQVCGYDQYGEFYGCVISNCDDPEFQQGINTKKETCESLGFTFVENCTMQDGKIAENSFCNESCNASSVQDIINTLESEFGTQSVCPPDQILIGVGCSENVYQEGVNLVTQADIIPECSLEISSEEETSSSNDAQSSSQQVSSSEEEISSSQESSSDDSCDLDCQLSSAFGGSSGSGTSSGSGSTSSQGQTSSSGGGTVIPTTDTIFFDDSRIVQRLDTLNNKIDEQREFLGAKLDTLGYILNENNQALIESLVTNLYIIDSTSSVSTIESLITLNDSMFSRLRSQGDTTNQNLVDILDQLKRGDINANQLDSATAEALLDSIENTDIFGDSNGVLEGLFDIDTSYGFGTDSFTVLDSGQILASEPLQFFESMKTLDWGDGSCPSSVFEISFELFDNQITLPNICEEPAFFINGTHILHILGDIIYWVAWFRFLTIIFGTRRHNPVTGE